MVQFAWAVRYFVDAMYFSDTTTMRPPTITIVLVVLLSATAAAQPRFEHGWAEARTWQDNSSFFPEEKIVALYEYEGYSVGDFLNTDSLPERKGILMELRILMEFRDRASMAMLDTSLIRLPLRSKVTHFDGRILHANGTRTELTKDHCIVAIDEHPYLSMAWQNLYFKNIPLAPGDQLEWILKTRTYGLDNLAERRVMVQWPTVRKDLMIELQDDVPFHCITQGAFPEGKEHRRGNRTGWSWSFTDMRHPSYAPLQVAEFGSPRFSIMSILDPDMSSLLRSYDMQHRYLRFSGRPHVHDFLNHIEARKKALGKVSNAELFKDVVTFVHDSIEMIADEELDVNRPIGEYFFNRRMTPERLVVLYRQLANLLEEPLYVGFTRGRYRTVMAPADLRAAHLDERFLAIKDPDSEGFLFITPNTRTQRYHFNEAPYWIAGQPALLMPFTEEGEKDKDPVSIVIPAPKPTDNSLAERIRLTYDPKARAYHGKGRSTAAGQLRVALDNSDVLGDEPEHPTLNAIARRHPLVDSTRTTLDPVPRTTYHFIPTIQPVPSTSQNAPVTTDLFPFLSLPTLEASRIPLTPGCLLPFPYHFRIDLHIDIPADHAMATTARDTLLENATGTVHYTFAPSPAGGFDWHLEHWISELWMDEEHFAQYSALMDFLNDRSYYSLEIKPMSPATSPASPAAPADAQR